MKAIVAADENWGIGREGKLLARIPEDLKYFRRMTENKAVVMGRKTLSGLPGGRPLENRTNFILTSASDFVMDGAVVCHSKKQVMEALGRGGFREVFIIGGGEVYRQFLPECTVIYVTRIQASFTADTHFPNLDQNPDWRMSAGGEEREYHGLIYRFCTYERVN